jgi:uncharacterized protein
MLLVSTRVQRSPIAGRGLFARQHIAAGQTWWEFDSRIDRTYSLEEFETLSEETKSWLKTYAYLQGSLWVLCGDDGIYVNHSDNPNSITVGNQSIALRDIPVGTEIVENYREFCDDWPQIPFLAESAERQVAVG